MEQIALLYTEGNSNITPDSLFLMEYQRILLLALVEANLLSEQQYEIAAKLLHEIYCDNNPL